MTFRAAIFLALRYLKPRWSFVSVITFLSLLGPILGVAILIVVIAVMNGFGQELREKIFGMQAHAHLKPVGAESIPRPFSVAAKLRAAGYQAVPVAEGPVLIQTRHEVVAKFVRGVGLAEDQNLEDVHPLMEVYGKARPGPGEAVVGATLASEFGLVPGDRLIIHPTGQLKGLVRIAEDGEIVVDEPDEPVMPEVLTVVGLFQVGMYDYDANLVITDLEAADDIFRLDWGTATSIQVWTDDPFALQPLRDFVAEELADRRFAFVSWHSLNRQIFDALAIERNMQFFLLTGIMVVAGFCISATLITVVVQKTREIGVLKAMGATPFTVLAVFLLQGVAIGLLGTVLGTALGIGMVAVRNDFAKLVADVTGMEVFPAELYHFTDIPARILPEDLLIINLSAFVICVAAGLLPALYAATKSPSDALRLDT